MTTDDMTHLDTCVRCVDGNYTIVIQRDGQVVANLGGIYSPQISDRGDSVGLSGGLGIGVGGK